MALQLFIFQEKSLRLFEILGFLQLLNQRLHFLFNAFHGNALIGHIFKFHFLSSNRLANEINILIIRPFFRSVNGGGNSVGAEGEARKNCGGQRSEGSETFSRGGGNEISHTLRGILDISKKITRTKKPGRWRDSIMKSIVS